MDYITVREASELWHTDISTIGKLLRMGKIPGAARLGGHWVIPKDTPKPLDGRTRTAKENPDTTVFRFPLYVNFPMKSFAPPLSKEEAELRQAQKYFYACDFHKAEVVFETLSENAENIYIRFCAHFYMCVLSMVHDLGINWRQYYCGLMLLLSQKYPFNKEMELFLSFHDFKSGQFMSIPEKLNNDSSYEYHSSALYLYACLSVFKLQAKSLEANDFQCLEPYKILCVVMEREGYYLEAQMMHTILFIAYYAIHNTEAMRYHMKRIVDIAYKHDLVYFLADIETYYSEEVKEALLEYPASFSERIRKASKAIRENFARFSQNAGITNLYSKLSKSDYRFVVYAVGSYSNKQVAELCHISERTVAKRYNDIYNKLGLNSKQELVTEMNIALGKKRVTWDGSD